MAQKELMHLVPYTMSSFTKTAHKAVSNEVTASPCRNATGSTNSEVLNKCCIHLFSHCKSSTNCNKSKWKDKSIAKTDNLTEHYKILRTTQTQ